MHCVIRCRIANAVTLQYAAVSFFRVDMEKQQRKDKWIAAGLAELAEHGLDGVRVELLAKRLGVTKGGFYRQFHDRQALLNAMLIEWGNGRIHAIRQQTALEREAPRDRLKSIIQLFAERANAQGAAIELAIRQWARSDEKAAATVVRVDEERLERVCDLYRRLGYSAQDA